MRERKTEVLQKKKVTIQVQQIALTYIPKSPVSYWLREFWLNLLSSEFRLENVALIREGLHTTNNIRFLRCFWECTNHEKRYSHMSREVGMADGLA